MFIVKGLIKTCEACPSQWNVVLEDGRMVYIRYRWGYLSVRVSKNKTENIRDAIYGKEICGVDVGGDLDGFMGFDELVGVTRHILDYTGVNHD